MTISNATQLATHIKTIFESIEAVKKSAKEIIASSDNRNFHEDFEAVAGEHANVLQYRLGAETDALEDTFDQLLAVLYIKDLESIRGVGTWRLNARTQHLVPTVKALRTDFPEIALRDARRIVEAFQAGMFE